MMGSAYAGENLLLGNDGLWKLGDFGSASERTFDLEGADKKAQQQNLCFKLMVDLSGILWTSGYTVLHRFVCLATLVGFQGVGVKLKVRSLL